jgi:probable F420-dependent oxidoreductase
MRPQRSRTSDRGLNDIMRKVKFGLYLPQNDFDTAKDVALRAERLGFYSVSINDHFVPQTGDPNGPQIECFTTLTGIAAVTSTIRLAPAVVSGSYRPPAMLAKITATLDHVSHGRLILGLGAGWQRSEYESHGYPFPPPAERIARLREMIKILKAMWTEASPSFTGEYYSIAHASDQPRPVQQPRIPLMLGGSSPAMLRLSAEEADIVNLIPPTSAGKDFLKDQDAATKFGMATLRERVELLRSLAEDFGRDPDEIEIGGLTMLRVSQHEDDPAFGRLAARLGFPDVQTARSSPTALLGTPEQVVEELHRRVAQVGVTYLILVPTTPDSVDLFVEEIMPAFAT